MSVGPQNSSASSNAAQRSTADATIDGAAPALPAVPAWVEALFDRRPADVSTVDGIEIRTTLADDVSWVEVHIPDAADLTAADFEAATAGAYDQLARRLSDVRARHPVRFWNFIPGIHAPSGNAVPGSPAMDRYMVFNAGRFDACKRWLGGEDAFPRLLATASGVGHEQAALVIHVLATNAAGSAVENPRQVPAYKYSHRYGPKPPCFARATTVDIRGRRRVLVGGTASVRGEESVYVGDLRKQFGETLDNLAALLQSATGQPAAGPHLLTDVRIYHVSPADVDVLQSVARLAFPAATVEYVRADICRQDLLVEIEGIV